MSKKNANKDKKSKHSLLVSRRDVLKAAGFTMTGGVLGKSGLLLSSCGNINTTEKETEDDHRRFIEEFGEATSSPSSREKGASTDPFPNLFSPIKIGRFQIRNRILSTGHETGLAVAGIPGDRVKRYWLSKAKGGIGLICTGVQMVSNSGAFTASCQNPEVIKALRPIAQAIHDNGAKLVAQLWHPGKSYGGSVAPSAIRPDNRFFQAAMPKALTISEIEAIIEDYAKSAVGMREANLDGVEVHMAHHYLPQQFMSPLHNIRTDKYGGSEKKRIQFPIEVLKAVRKAVGPDYTVGIRATGDELTPGGLTIDDMVRIVPKLVEAGDLDFVNVSLDGPDIIMPMGKEFGKYVYLAEAIKEVVDIPVFCIGRIVTPILAEQILAEGRADVVGMTRANIADPELPNKAREGRSNEIRICSGMMYCWGSLFEGRGVGHVTCALNPSAGREQELAITPAEKKRHVMVVGGGAAGMEAARVAAERGHSVSIYERENRLGGQLIIASKAPLRDEIAQLIAYYTSQFKRLDVDVVLNTTVTEEVIEKEKPDIVIVATGGLPKSIDVPGGNASNVVQGRDVLMGTVKTGQKIVLIGGENGLEAVTTANFLGKKGKRVDCLLPGPAWDLERQEAIFLKEKMSEWGVETRLNATVTEIQNSTVIILEEGQERTIEDVDTVVLAMGSYPNDAMIGIARSVSEEVYPVGQCSTVGDLHDTILDALSTVRQI